MEQTVPVNEVVVVNNRPEKRLEALPDGVVELLPAGNVGFARGSNLGAEGADTDFIFFLNPDAIARPDCVERLLEAACPEEVGLVGAQVVLPNGLVNAGDNPLFLNGVCWAGRFGKAVESGRARETAVVSGAAMLARTSAWKRLGGMNGDYFMYHDDVELALRMWIGGFVVAFQPGALVEHEYELDKGDEKWFLLERNRLRTVLTVYGALSLTLALPLLVLTEAISLADAVRYRWVGRKLEAWRWVILNRSAIAARRRLIQDSRRVGDSSWMAQLATAADSQLFPSSLFKPGTPVLAFYTRAATFIVALVDRFGRVGPNGSA